MEENVKKIAELDLDNCFDSIDKELGDIKDNIKDINEDIRGLSDRVSRLEGRMDFSKVVEPRGRFASAVVTTYKSIKAEKFDSGAIGENEGVACVDIKTGDEYATEELVDSRLLIPYREDGKEIFFFGQFNEKNHWDGWCTINVYENHKLVLITDAEYKDGEVGSYEQVFISEDKKTWLVAKRTHINDGENSYNVGETWQYIYEDYNQEFSFLDVSDTDIVSVEEFKKTMNLNLDGYYNGKTAKGFYNDDTGEAYLVKYADDGTVRTLYKGQFENGNFVDTTENAWYITKNIETDYMYYKGIFRNGHPTKEKDYVFENPISQKRINEIIEGMTFDCELNWFVSSPI